MRVTPRQLVLLAVSVIAFTAMVVLIATGITVRRAKRDLTFGLEELDVLLAEGGTEEAAAMVPWLARRAVTAGDGVRVLKRAHTLYRRTGDADPFHGATSTLLSEFPANPTIRTLAVFASVRSGRVHEALEMTDGDLGTEESMFFSWTLLSAAQSLERNTTAALRESKDDRTGPPSERDARSGDGFELLTRLNSSSPASDFERAWRLTGDARYALDAALLQLRGGELRAARETIRGAGLSHEQPLLTAGVLVDLASYDEAIALLEAARNDRAPPDRLAQDIALRLADAYLYSGNDARAAEVYEPMLETRRPPLHALVNAAWITREPGERSQLVRTAERLYPDSWDAARAAALMAYRDGDTAGRMPFDPVRWANTPQEGRARLLAARLDPDLERRGYAASLWHLLEEAPHDTAFHYAAWYFATRAREDDLSLVLDRYGAWRSTTGRDEQSWAQSYRGLLRAGQGDWRDATEAFRSGFTSTPSWHAALNAALSLVRLGEVERARARLQDAILLARNSRDHRRIEALLVGARLARDPGQRARLVREALELDPTSSEALLLARQLDNGGGR
jgi:tetratricopeptide (TPR) repeat protein